MDTTSIAIFFSRADMWVPGLVIGLACVFAVVLRRAEAGRALPSGGTCSLVLALVSVFAVVMPLFGYWAVGRTHPNALGGLLPWNDAAGYFACALSLLDGGELSSFCQRRSAYPLYLSGLLALTDRDLQLALLLQGLVAAVAIFAVGVFVARRWSPAAAILATGVLAAWVATVSVTTLTENLGFVLGAAGFVLFLSAVETRSPLQLVAGAFFISLALNARAGAFWVLPLLMLWPLFSPRVGRGQALRLVCFVCLGGVAGFVPGLVLSQMLGGAVGEVHSNFSYTAYGLVAGGKRWTYALTQLPGATSAEIYRATWALFLEQPHMLAVGLVQGLLEYLQRLLSYIQWFPAQVAVAVCWLWGLAGLAFRRDTDQDLVLALVMIGVFASAPVLSIDGGTRVFAATVAVDGAIAGLGLARLVAQAGQRRRALGGPASMALILAVLPMAMKGDPRAWGGAIVLAGVLALLTQYFVLRDSSADKTRQARNASAAWIVAAAALVVMIAVPFTVRATLETPVASAEANCAEGEDAIVLRLGRDSPVLKIVSGDETSFWPVATTPSLFLDGLHPLTARYEELRGIPAGTAIVVAYGIGGPPTGGTRSGVFVGDAAAVPADGRHYALCLAEWPASPLEGAWRIMSD